MPLSQADKALRFRALHQGATFLIPNPWDTISARLLTGLGFSALATSSAASAHGFGKTDGHLTREEALTHARTIVESTDLPVSADLENGFGDSPEAVATTVKEAAECGLVGCTIEDATRDQAQPIYDFSLAVERIQAAAEAARALPYPFMLTARAHGLLYPGGSLDETIRRLQAFEKAGAEVLFAPALPDLGAVRAVCASLKKPFNFMVGIPGKSFSLPELAEAGVRRVSVATSLYRAAMSGLLEAVSEIQQRGTFSYVERSVPTAELSRLIGA